MCRDKPGLSLGQSGFVPGCLLILQNGSTFESASPSPQASIWHRNSGGPKLRISALRFCIFRAQWNLAIFLGIVPLNFRENQGKDTICKMLNCRPENCKTWPVRTWIWPLPRNSLSEKTLLKNPQVPRNSLSQAQLFRPCKFPVLVWGISLFQGKLKGNN